MSNNNNNIVLCTCFKCKKNGKDNIGNYVHPTTKWRHSKKAKKNHDELNYDDDSDNDDNNEVEHKRY